MEVVCIRSTPIVAKWLKVGEIYKVLEIHQCPGCGKVVYDIGILDPRCRWTICRDCELDISPPGTFYPGQKLVVPIDRIPGEMIEVKETVEEEMV